MKLTNIVIKGNIINDILSNGDVQDQIEKYAKEKFNEDLLGKIYLDKSLKDL